MTGIFQANATCDVAWQRGHVWDGAACAAALVDGVTVIERLNNAAHRHRIQAFAFVDTHCFMFSKQLHACRTQ